jgi:hypothetical protein
MSAYQWVSSISGEIIKIFYVNYFLQTHRIPQMDCFYLLEIKYFFKLSEFYSVSG